MAITMKRTVLSDSLIALANEIRSKGGTQSTLYWPEGFVQAITDIEVGGTDWKAELKKQLAALPAEMPKDIIATLRPYCFYHDAGITDAMVSGLTALTTIGASAFEGCTSLTEIDFHGRELSIGANAFKDCSNLAVLNLADTGLTSVANLINGCSSLQLLDVSDNLGITAIAADNFKEKPLKSLNLSGCSNLASIGNYACHLTGMTSIDLSGCSSLASIGQYAFGYGKDNASQPCMLTELDLSGCTSLATIGKYAFVGTSMSQLTLPNHTMTTLEEYAFGFQSQLQGSLTIDVTNLGANSFRQCNISSVTIKNCNRYYIAPFSECTGLREARITMKPTGAWPSNITTYPVFYGCTNITDIYVPWSNGEVAENKFVKSSQTPTWHYNTVF